LLNKTLCNSFADSHRSARDRDNFACKFHLRVLFRRRPEVKEGDSNVVQSNRRFGPDHRHWRIVTSFLPLFPLDLVLLPGCPLPLHIFEPRYKEMIAECRANDSPFGVVRIAEKGFADVGCSAEIVSVVKEYADGRLDIVTEGRKRFEVLHVNQERSFLRAETILIEDEAGNAAADEAARAIQLHAEILKLAGAMQDISAADKSTISFYLAGSLPLDLDFKQKLLELRSESQRILALTKYLEIILPNIRSTARAREKGRGQRPRPMKRTVVGRWSLVVGQWSLAASRDELLPSHPSRPTDASHCSRPPNY
jgi:Lon protease-like protein